MAGLRIARVDGILRRLRRTMRLPVLQDLQVIPQHTEAAAFQLRLRLAALQFRQNGWLLLDNAEVCRQLLGGLCRWEVKKLRSQCDNIAVRSAAEAVEVLLVQLHAGRAVIVEGTADHVPLPNRQSVPLRCHARSDGGFHGFK